MNKILWALPSTITSISIMSGFLSILSTAEGNLKKAAWFIILSIFMDMLDGRVARLTKKVSEFGEQYDSLADLISFGVAPAFLTYNILIESSLNPSISFITSFLIILSGALRLARFNINSKNEENFQGMPIPAGAGIISSYTLFSLRYELTFSKSLLVFLAISISMLMISNLPYPSGKKKKRGRATRKIIFMAFIAIAMITYPIELFSFVGLFYLFYGPLAFLFKFAAKTQKR